MAPPKFKAPSFPHFFFALLAPLQPVLTIFYRIGGSVVEFLPATRETGFDSPPMHIKSSVVKVCCANYFIKFDVTFTGRQSLKCRGHLGLNRRPFDLQSKALRLRLYFPSSCSMAPPNFKAPSFLHFFFALLAPLQQALTIFYRIGGSVVEFLPATRETGFDSPPMHLRSSVVKVCCVNYLIKFYVTLTAR